MMRAHASDPTLAALPLAAALAIELARRLPVRFEYHENPLGIVSAANLQRYPLQQETFWLVFVAGVVALACWALARAFDRERIAAPAQAGLEGLGALGLLATLWLPGAAGALVCAAAAGAAIALARRAPRVEPVAAAAPAPAARSSVRVTLVWVALAVLLGALLTPSLWVDAWSVLHALPDARLVSRYFGFQAEMGQHLAWADAIRRGELHGRDFFCLYGPLYDIGLAGLWAATRRSVAALSLYLTAGRAASYAVSLLLCAALLRRKSLALALPWLLAWVDLRIGLALAGLLLLTLWLKRRNRGLALAAGAAAGLSLLYSQEFGLALLVSAGALFAVAREGKAAAAWAAGLGVVVAPLLGWFAVHGALGAMLRDLVQYPGYMIAGYGKVPFPSLVAHLPLREAALRDPAGLVLQLGHAAPAVCAGALLLCVPLAALRARQPLRALRAAQQSLASDPLRLATALVALFGVLAFRSALGRSDVTHVLMIVAPSALLVVIGLDRLVGAWIADPARRPIVAVRALALGLLVLHGGWLETPAPLRSALASFDGISTLARVGHAPTGSRHVQRVWRWVDTHTQPGEPVLFLPDVAAYYYLTQRASPIRFVLGHQIVTDAHRAEALAALRARPPRYVVWDEPPRWVDEIDPRRYLGAALVDWIESGYVEQARIGTARMLRRREPGERPAFGRAE
jgi:hypothetical protein